MLWILVLVPAVFVALDFVHWAKGAGGRERWAQAASDLAILAFALVVLLRPSSAAFMWSTSIAVVLTGAVRVAAHGRRSRRN